MNENFKVHACGPTSMILIQQMYGRVNCFDATGSLIIVIKCNIGAFFKKK